MAKPACIMNTAAPANKRKKTFKPSETPETVSAVFTTLLRMPQTAESVETVALSIASQKVAISSSLDMFQIKEKTTILMKDIEFERMWQSIENEKL
mmetsp:Transcript_24283/g.39655  ORF Transcript_24283/g.39655 Transcript_24283/m.39655 type:complete len:96 (-) Transcript_24283:36-323(-)